MIQKSDFVKEVPATESTIWEVLHVPSSGLAVILENLDAANSMTYKFQESADGVTWTDILFNVSNCTSQESTFTITAGNHHLVKVVPSQNRVRLRAYGTLNGQFGLMWRKASPFLDASGSVEILV